MFKFFNDQYKSFSETNFTNNNQVLEKERRILNALQWNICPTKIQSSYNKSNIKQVVREVNAVSFHYSGNCCLLAILVMYNFLNPYNCYLAAKNTYPIFSGIELETASHFLLKQDLKRIEKTGLPDMYCVEHYILKHYQATGECIFLITVDYNLFPFGRMGHVFNALIYIDGNNEPAIQYIDAWKCSRPLLSYKDLNKRFPCGSGTFNIYYCENKNLINDFSPSKQAIEKDTSQPNEFKI